MHQLGLRFGYTMSLQHDELTYSYDRRECAWGLWGGAPQRSEILENYSNVSIKKCASFHFTSCKRDPQKVCFLFALGNQFRTRRTSNDEGRDE
jgi:hypothetical protein